MFGIFKKQQKSDLEKQIETDGIEHAAKRFSEILLRKLPTPDIAYQFVLEELDGASQGNHKAKSFVKNSGIRPDEYTGSLTKSTPEVDGPDGPQQFLTIVCAQLQPNMDLAVDLRVMIVDNIMQYFSFGKYKGQKKIFPKGGLILKQAGVEILFVVCNNTVFYTNENTDHLFLTDKDGDRKLNGKIVNFVFSGQLTGDVVEVFVAFKDPETHTVFSIKSVLVDRLNFVAKSIFECFMGGPVKNVFSPAEQYGAKFIYAFNLYVKNDKYFMVNGDQTQGYLIVESAVLRNSVDEMKRIFWS